MKPRATAKARELFAAGRKLCQYTLAEEVFCAPSSARRILKRLHTEGVIRIAAWRRTRGWPLPVYAAGNKPDAPRVQPMTSSERMKVYRKRHPERIREQGKNRKILRIRRARRALRAMPDAMRALTFFGGRDG